VQSGRWILPPSLGLKTTMKVFLVGFEVLTAVVVKSTIFWDIRGV
jgi:hypothetical protein